MTEDSEPKSREGLTQLDDHQRPETHNTDPDSNRQSGSRR